MLLLEPLESNALFLVGRLADAVGRLVDAVGDVSHGRRASAHGVGDRRRAAGTISRAVGDDADERTTDRNLFDRALELIRCEFEERTWQAFWLTAVEDRPAGEVALELGMTPGAVRVAKSRVLRRLREELSEIPKPMRELRN